MKLKGLDGRDYSVSIEPKINTNASKNHIAIRELIKEMFPFENVVEEFSIPSTRLKCDFFLPSKRMVIEIHGEQHYSFNSHFFSSKKEFYQAKARDNKKIEWAEMNDFTLITLSYKENIDDWRDKIIIGLTT